MIVEGWRASGLSAEDYAERHNLGVHNLWRWSARHGKTAPASKPRSSRAPAQRFLAVEVAGPPQSLPSDARAPGAVEIVWPGGAIVRLSGDVSQTTLVAVMQALAEVASC